MKKTLAILLNLLLILFDSAYAKGNVFCEEHIVADTLKNKTSISTDTLRTPAADSSKIPAEEIIKPVDYNKLLTNNFSNSLLTKDYLNRTDYRYSGNFFSQIPFGFLRDFGFPGMPNEVLIYGQGFNNSTYLFDGINITNRLTNSYDLNLFQSESIDSIEILPLTEGFLYGNLNNPVTVNFIPADYQTKKPYTRIRYYQSANQEGFIDGIFNTTFGRKLGVFAEFTNNSSNYYYKNTGLSTWLGSVRIRYLLSDKINFIAGYQHSYSNTKLNGGVNYDSILTSFPASQVDQLLYNNIQAPVYYYNRYQKVTSNNFSLKTVAELIPNSPSVLTFYHQSNLSEFRQNDSSYKPTLQDNIVSVVDDNSYKTSGAKLEQSYSSRLFDLRASALIENSKFDSPLVNYINNITTYSIMGKASFKLFNENFIPSVYAKHLVYNKINFSGVGADIKVKLNDRFFVYAGMSQYQKPRGMFENNSESYKQVNTSAELLIGYISNSGDIKFGYFNHSNSKSTSPVIVNSVVDQKGTIYQYASFNNYRGYNLKGANLKLDLRFWKILINSNTSFYFSESDAQKAGVPQFTSMGGIYYVDTLFNTNLHLKSGFNYYLIGNRYNVSFDFERSISSAYQMDIIIDSDHPGPYLSSQKFPSNFQLDFFLAGQIREKAIVYFTFENLFDSNYFIVPYYPMQGRTIRFGVAWEFFN